MENQQGFKGDQTATLYRPAESPPMPTRPSSYSMQESHRITQAISRMALCTGLEIGPERQAAWIVMLPRRGYSADQVEAALDDMAYTITDAYGKVVTLADIVQRIEGTAPVVVRKLVERDGMIGFEEIT